MTFECDPVIALPLVIEWGATSSVYGDPLAPDDLKPRIVNPVTGFEVDDVANGDAPLVNGENYHLTFVLGGEVIQDTAISDAVQYVKADVGTSNPEVRVIPTESGASKGAFVNASMSVLHEIVPRVITATPIVQPIVYGDQLPMAEAYEIEFAGIPPTIPEDVFLDENLVSLAAEFAPMATADSGVGVYGVAISGLSGSGNVEIVNEEGRLEITPAPLTITADDLSRPFGQDNGPLTATITGWVHDDERSFLLEPIAYEVAATGDSEVGVYTIEPNGAVASDYTITFVQGRLTIVKADQSVAFADIEDLEIDRRPLVVTLEATSSAGLPVSYTLLEGVGELVGDSLTNSEPGAFAISAGQTGDASRNAAPGVIQRFQVSGRAVVVDSDDDGLPDSFEEAYFENSTSAVPDEDSDCDRFSNRAEWLFGTSPIDSRSSPVLQIDSANQRGAIKSVTECLYTLEVSEDLEVFTAIGESILVPGRIC